MSRAEANMSFYRVTVRLRVITYTGGECCGETFKVLNSVTARRHR